MTARRTLGQITGLDGKQLDVEAIAQIATRQMLFSIHVAAPTEPQQVWTRIWTGTREMRLRAHEPTSPHAAAVLDFITPEVWEWAWRHTLAESRRRETSAREELRLAELDVLLARAHTGDLAAPTPQAVISLADAWTGTAAELLEAAVLIDQETDHA